MLFESGLEDVLLLESLLEELPLDDVDGVEPESPLLLSLFAALFDRFEGPEYRSDSQPPPFRMKLPPVIMRRASSLPQLGHCPCRSLGTS
ncbi:MAG: hypothetical protein JRF54_15190 [Deltaproteobacteria bacterium]|nr:hypothetical protein [Deltaproteobacteria bacterium]